MLEPHADRVTWDAPLHSGGGHRGAGAKPRAINSKPSRFGSLGELFAVYEHCERRGHRDLRRRPGRAGPGEARSSTWPRSFTPTPRTTSPPPATTTRRSPDGLPSSPLDPTPSATAFAGASGRSAGRTAPLERGVRSVCRTNETRRSDAAEALRRRAQRADRQRVRRPPAVHRAAVYYDFETLPRLAAFFYRQAVEERTTR